MASCNDSPFVLQQQHVSPDLPGGVTAGIEFIEDLFVLECIHTLPEPVIVMAVDAVLRDQAPKWLINQFFARLYISKDVPTENEITTIDPQICFPHGLYSVDNTARTGRNGIQTRRSRMNGQKCCECIVVSTKIINKRRKVKICQAVAIVGKEYFLSLEVWLNEAQSVCNCGTQSCVDERYFPVVDIPLHKLQAFATLREDKII